MLRILVISFLFLGACESRRGDSDGEASISSKIRGTWVEVQSVCNGKTFTPEFIENEMEFKEGGTYEVRNKTPDCRAMRTGTYSTTRDRVVLSFSTISCSPSPCQGAYRVNESQRQLECPSGISRDGQNFKVSVDNEKLFLTPTLGLDSSCYYEYRRKSLD